MSHPTDQNRVRAGVREGGQFSTTVRAEAAGATGALARPVFPTLDEAATRDLMQSVMEISTTEAQTLARPVAAELNRTRNYSDEAVHDAVDRVGSEVLGYKPSGRTALLGGLAEMHPTARTKAMTYLEDQGVDVAGGDPHMPVDFPGEDEDAYSLAATAAHATFLRAQLTGEAPAPTGNDAAIEALLHAHRNDNGECFSCPHPADSHWRADYPCEVVQTIEKARAAAGQTPVAAPAGTPQDPVPADDPRVMAGEVFDAVVVDGTTFHRRRDGVFPSEPYELRFQADRPISDDEMHHMASLAGYAMSKAGRGEGMGQPERDTPYSFTVFNDTTKGRQYRNLEKFEDALPDMIKDGSDIRKTDRSGPGTAGTRLVEGMANPPKVELYYDNVFGADED